LDRLSEGLDACAHARTIVIPITLSIETPMLKGYSAAYRLPP
jgi:hypothetical protein